MYYQLLLVKVLLEILWLLSLCLLYYWKYFPYQTMKNFLSFFKRSMYVLKSRYFYFFFVCVFWFSRFIKVINLTLFICSSSAQFSVIIQLNISLSKDFIVLNFLNQMFCSFSFHLVCKLNHLY